MQNFFFDSIVYDSDIFSICICQCKVLEQHMEKGEVLKEYESIPKRPRGEYTIAQLPESGDRNRFQDVLPYDDTRVELVPTKENNTGYINASHIRVSCFGDVCTYICKPDN